MSVFVGQKAADFTATAVMPDNSVNNAFNLESMAKHKYCMLMFYPLDFTFVCPSELVALNKNLEEFNKRDCLAVSISIDSHFTHLAWKNTALKDGGISNVQFPMISDLKKEISSLYGVLNSDGVSVRGTFIIDKEFVLRHILINDLPIGRSLNESLRVLDAIEHHAKHGEVCPANWIKGDDAMSPTSSGVKLYMEKHLG
jgi:peroxiredoxin (alkyl hydroperoxide reductase subunit C)